MLKLAKFYILNMNSLLCANRISGYTKQTKILTGVQPPNSGDFLLGENS